MFQIDRQNARFIRGAYIQWNQQAAIELGCGLVNRSVRAIETLTRELLMPLELSHLRNIVDI